MAEPTVPASVGIVTLAVALLGPMAGPYAVIVLSALAGALWALAAAPTESRRAGAWLVLRLVLTAVVLAGGVAWGLESQYGWPAHQLLAPVAFATGMGGDRWRALVDVLVATVGRRIGGGA
jgi:hypothetical protein